MLFASQHSGVRAGHSGVAQKRGALRQNPGIGGRDVSVGADNGRCPSIEVPAQRLLFRGSLGVDFHQNRIGLAVELGEHPIAGQERALRFERQILAPENREHGEPHARLFQN